MHCNSRLRALADSSGLDAKAGFYAASDKAIAIKHSQLLDFSTRAARAWARTHQYVYAKVLFKETGIPLNVARFTVTETSYGIIQLAPSSAVA